MPFRAYLVSERYERSVKNYFSILDEITMKILAATQVKLTSGEEARVYAKETTNLEAYLKLMEARNLNLTYNKVNLIRARQLAEESISLDSQLCTGLQPFGNDHQERCTDGRLQEPAP